MAKTNLFNALLGTWRSQGLNRERVGDTVANCMEVACCVAPKRTPHTSNKKCEMTGTSSGASSCLSSVSNATQAFGILTHGSAAAPRCVGEKKLHDMLEATSDPS